MSNGDNNSTIEWSPFYCLPKAELTPSGLIQLDTADNEVLLLRRSNVEFRHDGPTPMAPRPRSLHSSERWKNQTSTSASNNNNNNLILTITTHRFIFMYKHENNGDTNNNTNNNNIDARFVHLSNVKTVEAKGGPSLMSPNSTYKIVLTTQTYDDLILVFRSSTLSYISSSASKDDRDQSLGELKTALERKRWEVAARLQETNANFDRTMNNTNKVGLDRILTKNKLRHKENAKLAEQALSGDSDNLLQEAAQLLKVIQKYTVLVQKFEANTTSNNNNGDNNDDEEAALKLKGLLSDMGMTSALSQSKMAGGKGKIRRGFGRNGNSSRSSSDQQQREFHELTARQVADFLVPRLRKGVGSSSSSSNNSSNSSGNNNAAAGMMSLTDVYCLFNRARGTNLISPEDLRDACSLLGTELKVGLSQRTFPSGIVVLQLDDLALSATNYKARRTMIELCSNSSSTSSSNNGTSNSNNKNNEPHGNGISALEASHVLRLSPLLASEQLEEAERLGWLCRDATLSTVRFHPNKFQTSF